MSKRTGRKVILSSAAVIGGLALGTVAEAAGTPEGVGSAVDTTSQSSSALSPTRPEADLLEVNLAYFDTTTTTVAPTTTAAPTTVPPTTAPPTTAPPAPVRVAQAPPPTAPPTTAAPAPAPAPAPVGSVEEAIAAWFPDVYDKAVRVARCESSLNPSAVSAGGGNHGLFQINNVHRSAFTAVTGQPWDAVYSAYYNSQFARHLYNQSGWQPWGCRGA